MVVQNSEVKFGYCGSGSLTFRIQLGFIHYINTPYKHPYFTSRWTHLEFSDSLIISKDGQLLGSLPDLSPLLVPV